MRLRAGRKASEAAPSSDYFPSVMVRQAEGFVQQRGVCVCVCLCLCVCVCVCVCSTVAGLVLELGGRLV